jgi:predicted transcriptional regulator
VPNHKANIDAAQVEALSRIGCTQDEIAAVLKCTARTLRNRFSKEMKSGREQMKMSLRRWQYEKAKEGNVTMLIWLGKQYLDQRDKNDTKVTEEVVTIERIAPKLGLADTA